MWCHAMDYYSTLKGMNYWYMLQNGWILNTLCQVKDVNYKKQHMVWFHWYEMSRTGIFIGTESTWKVTTQVKAGVRWGSQEVITRWYHVNFWSNQNVVKCFLVMVAQFWEHLENHSVVCFKWVICRACEL